MAGIRLDNLEETRRLGRWLADHLPGSGVRALLLRGPLGSGKTTADPYRQEDRYHRFWSIGTGSSRSVK